MPYITEEEVLSRPQQQLDYNDHMQRFMPEVDAYIDEGIYYLVMFLNAHLSSPTPRTVFSCEGDPDEGGGYLAFESGQNIEWSLDAMAYLLQRDIDNASAINSKSAEALNAMRRIVTLSEFDLYDPTSSEWSHSIDITWGTYSSSRDNRASIQGGIYIPQHHMYLLDRAAKAHLTVDFGDNNYD